MKTFSIVLFLLIAQLNFGQTAKDYFNDEVKNAQRKTARSIMTALEKGATELAMNYFDNSINELKSNLSSVSSEISKVKAKSKLSIIIVFNQGYNIYRCRYYNESGELYQVDLFMSEGQPNSKVRKLKTKNSKVLKAEQKKRIKSNDAPPPPN
ncbi:hypothetical protein HN014_15155 [Aquimarina sp. TRL1]|uniref:hypothetical protein n=1 Tax=Aquimarina sp. (strain TRL1) TaxID=2736252 RepID=UPI00158BD27C|nr:hypothetical protein [Aquimarina sp. TRL1]QKX06191.1 hypothetical protein HN014_15155 [Aquimarina sp. TRL1]